MAIPTPIKAINQPRPFSASIWPPDAGMVDTTEAPVARSALAWIGGRPLLNSVNLEEGDAEGTRLDSFLSSLPEGFRYGVEVRNPEYLTPEYLDLLASRNVAHVFNAWTRMPELEDQAQIPEAFTADFTVVRA